MNSPSDIGVKPRLNLATRYPVVDSSELLTDYVTCPIEHRTDEIEKHHVVFWHRLLRLIYDQPVDLELRCSSDGVDLGVEESQLWVRKTVDDSGERPSFDATVSAELRAGIDANQVKFQPVNWKYLVRLPNGGCVELSTKDGRTIFSIALVQTSSPNREQDKRDCRKFIDLLLSEALRHKDQLFSPSKQFGRQEGTKLYFLRNVYLVNHKSSASMLAFADTHEPELHAEVLRFDARTSAFNDEENRQHIDHYMAICGMFYCSSISYSFMALEGFVNLVFHSFLKRRFRDGTFKPERDLNLEKKIGLMPIMCDGFDQDSEIPESVASGLKKISAYRNRMFHSNVADAVKELVFVEDHFVYVWRAASANDSFVPTDTARLTREDVVAFGVVVDEIVNFILGSMLQPTRTLTEKTILTKTLLSFKVLEAGQIEVG